MKVWSTKSFQKSIEPLSNYAEKYLVYSNKEYLLMINYG